MVRPRDTTLRYDDDRRIQPPIYNGVKTMSYGYVKGQSTDLTQAGAGTSADSSGAFIRGPLASSAVKQLASETAWGSLDFLVVDFPPGTGDIQLTLTQSLRIAGAVVVTTPGKLSFVDVAKGLALFQRTGVPVMALVENMSYFVCGNCDTKHRLFGERGAEYLAQLQARFGGGSVVGGSPTTDSNGSSSSEQQQLQSFPPPFPVLELPIWPAMARASDEGDPIMLSHDDANKPVRDVYAELARSVQQRLMGAQGEGAAAVPTLTFDAKSGHVVLTDPASSSAAASDSTAAASSSSSPAARSVSLPARSLRLACRCAGCVDELSGKPRLDPARVPADVRPIGMQPRGNYAVAVHWSDGHASSLYPFEDIRKLAAQASSA
jgi:MinD-like ATPase involved in chromosome partitioning or flagellar assembly